MLRLLPWDYGVRNLLRRPLRTVLTAAGLTLVVFLLLLVLSFARGLESSLQRSGDEDVVLIHSIAAEDNLENSSISDQVMPLVKAELSPLILHFNDVPAMSPELTISSILQVGEGETAPQLAVFRGVRPDVFLVRREVFIIAGTFPRSDELLVGRLAAAKLGLSPAALAVGSTLLIEGKPRRISGHFAAPGTFLEAEIWCPLDDLKLQMKRPNDLSLVAIRLNDRQQRKQQLGDLDYFCRFRHRDLELLASEETSYYGSLRRHYQPLQAMVWLLVALVSLAGACGAINTMYAAVASRVREFAALQAVGFQRRAIGLSLIQESVLLAALATLLATALALVMVHGAAIRFTMGAFTLQLDGVALLISWGVGVGVGLLGAIPPAIRALRLPIPIALKAV